MTINANKVFIMAIILTYPINIKVISFLRITDIFILVMFLRILHLNTYIIPTTLWFKVFGLILAASTANGLIFIGFEGLDKIPFIYKLVLPFLSFYVLDFAIQQLSSSELIAIKFFFIGFTVVFMFWPFVYFFLHITDLFSLNTSWRASFPGTWTDRLSSDGHLLSLVLTMNFLAIYILHKHHFTMFPIIFIGIQFIVLILGIGLTGSRTGFAVLLIALFILSTRTLLKLKIQKPKFKKGDVVLGALVLGSLGWLLQDSIDFSSILEALERVVSRAFTLSLGGASELARIGKFFRAVEQLSAVFPLLGIGFVSNSGPLFYDNTISLLLVYLGPFGAIFYLAMVARCTLKCLSRVTNRQYKNSIIIFISIYIFGNFISEYFTITRGLLPVILSLVILKRLGEK